MYRNHSRRHIPTCLKYQYLYLGNKNGKWEGKARQKETLTVYFIYFCYYFRHIVLDSALTPPPQKKGKQIFCNNNNFVILHYNNNIKILSSRTLSTIYQIVTKRCPYLHLQTPEAFIFAAHKMIKQDKFLKTLRGE